MTIALIDGDIITYRVGFTTEDKPEEIAYSRVEAVVSNILEKTNADDYKIFLTHESDPAPFRKSVYPEYKANRTQPRPVHYSGIREFLVGEFGASASRSGLEADDEIGIAASSCRNGGNDFIVVSIDKDLLQITGKHYNWVRDEFCEVDNSGGLRHFYSQLLIGDKADNVKGVRGIGDVKAKRYLENAELEGELFNIVRDLYGNDEEMLMNGRVLWIWKKEDDDWQQHYDRLIKENA